jgi:hypothetical protein
MNSPIPPVEESRKRSKQKVDIKVASEREEVIAAIHKADGYQCRFEKRLYNAIKQELSAAGYDVETTYLPDKVYTTITW